MKSTPFIIIVTALTTSVVGITIISWIAFMNGFYWADRYKDTVEIPDSVQAISTLTGWVFWAGISLFILQAIGLITLFFYRKQVK